MKKLIPTGLIALILAISASSALACPGGKGERKIDRAVEKLELTTEQESQFREIMEAKKAKMKSHREAQRAETLDQLKTVLTDKQLAEFEEMSQRRHNRKHKDKPKDGNS